MAFIFVIGHSLAIFIFAFPTGYLPQTLKNAASIYVHPMFEQTWSLFAPCPIHDTKMRVKYYFEEDSTDWVEPMKDVYELHARYRFTYHGDLAVGESNVLYYTMNDLIWKGISPYEPFPVDSAQTFFYTSSFYITKNFVYGSADFLYGKRPVSALVECSFNNVKTGESGTLILPEFVYNK